MLNGLNVVDIVLWFAVFLFSLAFHESAHAWTSERFGDSTARYLGRVTLNPIPHIDPIGTVLLPIIGMVTGGMMIGWAKPTPVNPMLWTDKKKANILVSAAGPISNTILAAIAFVILKVLISGGILDWPKKATLFYLAGPPGDQASLLVPISKLLSILLSLNIMLGIFNLFPVPPLDGSHVLESLLPPPILEAYEQIRPFGFILLIALLYLGVFSFFFDPIMRLVVHLLY
ncbi:MAG TPA: site-2 protease family protein [Blastocatellia bacterium]